MKKETAPESKIIQPPKAPFSMDDLNAIGGAYAKLEELNTKAILETSDAAEKRGLTNFLQEKLLEHGPELCACWHAVKFEYEPLIFGFRGLFRRAFPTPAQQQQGVDDAAKRGGLI